MSVAQDLRIGILSTANIARKNAMAIRDAKGVTLVGVSSRSLEKAQEWAKTWGVPKAYGSHEELLNDPEIEAVYIPMPTGARGPFVIAAANAKKHILCEKPVAPTTEEAQKMIAACQDNGVVFMDGVMFMHNPRLDAIKAAIKNESFGELKRVNSEFSFPGDDNFHANNIRIQSDMEPLGSLGDLGWYNIRLAMFAFDWAVPVSASAVATKSNAAGVPIELSSTIIFPEGKTSTFTCSFDSAFRQCGAIVGTKQTIEITDFVLSGEESSTCGSFGIITDGLTEYDLLPKRQRIDQKVTYHANQEVCMWENFAALCRSKDAEKMKFYADVALNTQRITNAVLASASKNGAVVDV